jgi:nickel/cobalt transporter (NiCoT) family protein
MSLFELASVVELAILIGCANIGAWVWAFVAFRDNSILLGTALLAYTLGLCHAVDADHIAAIDNVTRKLVQEGKRPASVGFFFSLGHATTVVIGSLVAYSMASAAERQFGWMKSIGAVIGTSVSAAFLVIIALVNLVILGRLCRNFCELHNGHYSKDQSRDMLSGGGILTRFLRCDRSFGCSRNRGRCIR